MYHLLQHTWEETSRIYDPRNVGMDVSAYSLSYNKISGCNLEVMFG